ncbi:hypothetical protein FPOA_06840 [Fusarium poae]|uniref:Apple domain-containing protein n=1 Tax=Fusarium poae TaxID=36050 RepID=A0A1B8AIT1_FUSPO|nr:hypothetical protein FPOA_06840 [Fusarium poae]
MSNLVRSFILAAVLPLVNAGPCKPSSSSTVLGLTTTESTETGVAKSTDVVSTSETYTLTSTSEDVSTTIQSFSSTVGESVLFTTTAETSSVVSSDETSVASQTDTTTTLEDITSTILESSTTDDQVLPTPTYISTLTSELPTTTTAKDVTLTSTEPSETTTEDASACKYDKRNPLPKDLLCGGRGYSSGSSGAGAVIVGMGRYGTELECVEDCAKNPSCKLLIVLAGNGGFCELWSKVFPPSDDGTPWKWYEPGCFCEAETETTTTETTTTEATTTEVSEVLPTTTTEVTSEIEPTTTTTEDITLTSTETVETMTESATTTATEDITFTSTETVETMTESATTTTMTEDVTLTSTEPSETTTEAATICVNDKKSPPPKDLVCGTMGTRTTGDGYMGEGRYGSELECVEDCRNTPSCKFVAVQAGGSGFCELWSQVNPTSDFVTRFHWYEPGCFCDSPESEPEVTQTQAPEP